MRAIGIAGHCGLDPWFRARDFNTIVGEGSSIGDVPVDLKAFFGTNGPFFGACYGQNGVTVDDAIAALKAEIERLSGHSSAASIPQ